MHKSEGILITRSLFRDVAALAMFLSPISAWADTYHLFYNTASPVRGFVAVCVEIEQANVIMQGDIVGIGSLVRGFSTDDFTGAVSSLPHKPLAVLVGDRCIQQFIEKYEALVEPMLRAKVAMHQFEF